MTFIIMSVVGAAIFWGSLILLNKQFTRRDTSSSSKDIADVEEQISAIDSAIEQAFIYCDKMIPLADSKEREDQIVALGAQLAEAQEKLQKLDQQVEKLQATVEEEEAHHNELKKGKEEAALLAHEIREHSQALESECAQLEQQLQNSQAQLTALSTEIKLTNEQTIAMNKINAALEKSHSQLQSLIEIHTLARNRFLNLETQYVELEKEFTKLVEKELSGD